MIDIFNGLTHDQNQRIERVAKALNWDVDEHRRTIKDMLEHCEKLAAEELLRKISEIKR